MTLSISIAPLRLRTRARSIRAAISRSTRRRSSPNGFDNVARATQREDRSRGRRGARRDVHRRELTAGQRGRPSRSRFRRRTRRTSRASSRGRIASSRSINVTYPNDNGSPGFSAHFFPSGTVTTDGWYEVVTNPFSVQGSRAPTTASLSISANGADVDALEIVPSGTFTTFAACAPPVDAACGAHQFCETGWCRDGNNGRPAAATAERAR